MKRYLEKNVYDAAKDRIKYVFDSFEQVVVSFSGGKDSGVILNMALEYAKEEGVLNKLAVYHMDYEAQYQMTTDYVERTFESLPKEVKQYWVCLPIKAQCATSMFQDHWKPWLFKDKDIWCRELPNNCVNEENYSFSFDYNIWDYKFNVSFGKELSKDKKTAFIIGIRAQESLNRFRAVARDDVNRLDGKNWTVKVTDNLYNVYPIYDWETEDVWVANARFGWDYNKLYDLYYQAGLTIHQMRVASPFNDCAMDSLKLYKAIDPNNWGKMVGRVNGVNFAGLYGGTTAMGWRSVELPKGHTWKSYMYFLLSTLPKDVRYNYLEKLEASKKSWLKGGLRDKQTISELEAEGAEFTRTGIFKGDKEVIRFNDYLDDTTATDFSRVPTYKRMCICIMKNDHACKYMGFSQNKRESQKRKAIMDKYKSLL